MKPDYVKCIQHAHADKQNKTWCGRTRDVFEWTFTSLDHASYNNMNGGRLLLCELCVAEGVKHLQHNAADMAAQQGEQAPAAKAIPDPLRTAVAAFIKAKGRYHTEQGYKALVEAFDKS